MRRMDSMTIALLLKPLGVIVLFGCVALPGRFLVQRFMRPGRIKELLLLRIHGRW